MSLRSYGAVPTLLVVALVVGAYKTAAPRPVTMHVDQHLAGARPDSPMPNPARGDTLWFGGDDGNGHPFEGGVWDFDSITGDPFQGWQSVDLTTNAMTYFSHVTEAEFLAHGDPVVPMLEFGGMPTIGQIWCGIHQDEAIERDFLGGMGYQNVMRQCARSPIYAAGPGCDPTMTFDFFCHSEPYYDYTYVYIVGFDQHGDEICAVRLDAFDGANANEWAPWTTPVLDHTVTVPLGLLDDATTYHFEFRMVSDGGWSDEDGLWDSPGGPFAFDNVEIIDHSGAVSFDFDTGAQGWSFEKCAGIGEYVSIIEEADWEPWVDELGVLCQCGLGSNTLGFVDVEGSPLVPPGLYDGQKQMVWSPAIGRGALPGEEWNAVVAQFDAFIHMHVMTCAYCRPGYMYYPYTTAVNPQPHWSPRRRQNQWLYWTNSFCEPLVFDLSYLEEGGDPLPSDWDSVKFAFEVYCWYQDYGYWYCEATGETHGSPLIDNVRLGVYQGAAGPCFSLIEGGEFMDGFGQYFPSYLEPSDRGGANIVLDLGGGPAPQNHWLADSSAIIGPPVVGPETRWLAEIRVRIASQGARQDLIPEYHAWKARLTGDPETEFVAVQMDSCMSGINAWTHKFCTYIHEDDPAFDPAYPHQSPANDILPDGIFVPGTSIEYYFAAWWKNLGMPPGDYSTSPVREFEILPSMILVPGEEYEVQWPCVLYVDAYNHGGEQYIEAMLSVAGVAYDKYDYLHAASNFNAPLKRSYGGTGFNPGGYGNNGCTLKQLLGYRLILVSTGNYAPPCMEPEDFELFGDWLANTDCGNGDRRRGIIFDGDGAAGILAHPTLGHAPLFASNVLGVAYEAESYRAYNEDEAYCVYLEPGTSSAFEPQAPGIALFGSGCPRIFDYDVLGTQAGIPGVTGNLRYFSYGGTGQQSHVDFAQVVRENAEPGVANWRSVVNGFSLHHLTPQQADCPNDSASIVTAGLTLLMPQLEWMSDPADLYVPWRYLCGGLGTEPDDEVHLAGPVDHLYAARPNPFAHRAVIRFSLAQHSHMDLDVYSSSGRLIRSLVDGPMPAGEGTCTWDGLDDSGQRCATGIYWMQMRTAGGYTSSKRLLRFE